MINRILYLLFFFLCSLQASSYFTLNSLGDPSNHSGVYGMGAGNTGLSLISPHNQHPFNQSLTGMTDRTLIYVAVTGDYLTLKNNQGSGLHINYYLPSFRFVVSLKKYLKLGLEYQNLYQNYFSIRITDQIITNDTIAFNSELTKKGGLQSGNIFLAFRIKQRYLLATSLVWYFGASELYKRFDFNDTFFSDGYANYVSRFSGQNLMLSFTVPVDSSIWLGGYYSPAKEITVSRSNDIPLESDIEVGDNKIDLGQRFGVGITWKVTPKWQLTMDGQYEGATKGLVFESNIQNRASDFWQIGLGIERSRNYDFLATYKQRISWRGGIYWQAIGIESSAGDPLREIGLTLGATLPMKSDFHAVNFAVQFGRRGNIDTFGVQETVWRFLISFSGLETWGTRRGFY